MSSISSANAVFMLGVTGLFAAPQQLQGFDVDDAFDAEGLDAAETKIGIDGIVSAGFVYTIAPTTIALQADSPSVSLFEAWYTAERAAQDKYFAFGQILLPSIGRSYTLVNGVLKKYTPFSSAKKMLQPRSFTIDWESIIGAAI